MFFLEKVKALPILTTTFLAVLFPDVVSRIGISPQASVKRVAEKPVTAFDVVSIRPSSPGSTGGFYITAEGYRQSASPLITAIVMAYLPMDGISIDRVKNAPAWVSDVPYDIEAKVPPDGVPTWETLRQTRLKKPLLEKLLQAVLADRCGLKVRQVPIEVPAYALVLGRRDMKLLATRDDEAPPSDWSPIAGGGWVKLAPIGSPLNVLKFRATSMSSLTTYLNMSSGGIPVIDQTQTEGKFDFELPRTEADPQVADLPSENRGIPWDVRVIGLKVMRSKSLQYNIFVDAIHRPSPN